MSQWTVSEFRGTVEEEEPQEILREGAVRSQETSKVVLQKLKRGSLLREEGYSCGVNGAQRRGPLDLDKVKVGFFADVVIQ